MSSTYGAPAVKRFLNGLDLAGGELWFKVGNDRFYRAIWDGSDLTLWATQKHGDDPRSRAAVGQAITGGIEYLLKLSQTQPGGVFFIPTQPQGFPLADCVEVTDDIGIECDDITGEAQLTLYQEFEQVSGIQFHSILSSGGKSVHGHLKTDRAYPVEGMNYLRRLAIIAVTSDPVTERLHQPMRFPGFYRAEKGRWQELIKLTPEARYTPQAMLEGFERWFTYRGWEMPATVPADWFSECFQRAYRSGSGLTPEQKIEKTRELLAVGPEAWQQQREAEAKAAAERRRLNRARIELSGQFDLSEAIKRVNESATVDDFDFVGANWQGGGSKWRGPCAFHESQSGTGAWVDTKGGVTRYHCYACTNNRALSLFEFEHRKASGWSGGQAAPRLEGKAFVEAATTFLSSHGVTVPAPGNYRLATPAPAAAGPGGQDGSAIYAQDAEQERVDLAQEGEVLQRQLMAILESQLEQAKQHTAIAATYSTHQSPPAAADDVVVVSDQGDAYRMAIASGARLVVNVTGTGGNKTGFIANSHPEDFGAAKLISVTPDLLNVENFNPAFSTWAKLEGGHHGVVEVEGKRYRATIDTPESAKIAPGNCGKATAIQAFNSRNPVNTHLPCLTCSALPLCQKGEGEDLGRRYQAQQAWASTRILTNYGRLRGIGLGEEVDNLGGCVLHLDEPSTNVETTKTLTVGPNDLLQTIAELSIEEPCLHEQLTPLLRWLHSQGYEKLPQHDRRWGIGLAGMLEQLRSLIPAGLDWQALSRFEDGHHELAAFGANVEKLTDAEKRRLKKLNTKRESTKNQAKRVAELEAKSQAKDSAHIFTKIKGAKGFRQAFGLDGLTTAERKELRQLKKAIITPEEKLELEDLQHRYDASKVDNLGMGESAARAKELRLRWLGEFIAIVMGDQRGHIRAAHGELVVTIQDRAHLNAIQSAKLTILTDASEVRTRRAASEKYGIPEDQILIFEVGRPTYQNSELIQVTGLGKMGRNRGEGLEKCKEALVAKLKELDPTHVHFDQKAYSHDARLFADSIGSNEFKECTSISATPPRPSVNGLLDEYCTRRGVVVGAADEGFQGYYSRVYAELIRQWIGRTRANLKPGQHHRHYLLTDDTLPITPDQVMPAYEICPEAARKGQRTIMAMVKVAQDLLSKGERLTQQAIAAVSQALGLNGGRGYAQRTVSKYWVDIQAALALFLKGTYKKSAKTPEQLKALVDKASILSQVAASVELCPPADQVSAVMDAIAGFFAPEEIPEVLDLMPDTARSTVAGILAALFLPDLPNKIPPLEPLNALEVAVNAA